MKTDASTVILYTVIMSQRKVKGERNMSIGRRERSSSLPPGSRATLHYVCVL
jgi:hypothetical protein